MSCSRRRQLLGSHVAAPAGAAYLFCVAAPAGATYLFSIAAPAGTAYLLGIATPAGTAYLGIRGLSSNAENLQEDDGEELKHGEGELLE
jgi:hypothetical protein